eukprot:9830926-Alexandrium_andersonii.AAC.1
MCAICLGPRPPDKAGAGFGCIGRRGSLMAGPRPPALASAELRPGRGAAGFGGGATSSSPVAKSHSSPEASGAGSGEP